MSSRKAKQSGQGWGVIIGLVLLLLILAWPLLVFHRHWTTTRLFNCATDYADAVNGFNGCTYDLNTGNYSGTGTLTITHSAISVTGWIVQLIWAGFLAGGIVAFRQLDKRKQRQHAEEERQRAADQAARFTHLEAFNVMSSREFEEALATLCTRDGCRDVRVTGKAGDLGADVVALTPEGGRLVIQAKRYGPKTLVSGPDLQKFAGTARALHHANVAVVVTTSRFTKQARVIADPLNILLFDGAKLAGWASGTGPSPWQAGAGASST
jgi:restriction system protein